MVFDENTARRIGGEDKSKRGKKVKPVKPVKQVNR
jgi:hypothetical protein